MNATDLETRHDNAVKPFAGLTCPKCGAEDCISLDLDDLISFHCRECEDCFDVNDVRKSIEQWSKVLAWIDAAK